MSIETYYVRGTSKKDVNARLEAGERITARNYSMFNDITIDLTSCGNGDVIKIWSKATPSGTPIAKSYGNWDSKKGRVK